MRRRRRRGEARGPPRIACGAPRANPRGAVPPNSSDAAPSAEAPRFTTAVATTRANASSPLARSLDAPATQDSTTRASALERGRRGVDASTHDARIAKRRRDENRARRVVARASLRRRVSGTRPSRKDASICCIPQSADEILPRDDAAKVRVRTVRAVRVEACMTPCILLRRGVRRRVRLSRAGASEECDAGRFPAILHSSSLEKVHGWISRKCGG